MGNTISSSPRPVSTQTTGGTAPTTATPTTGGATGTTTAAPDDTFTPIPKTEKDKFNTSHYNKLVKTPTTKTGDDYKNLSNEDVKKITPEEVKGMTMRQLMEYTKNVDKEGGVGRDQLDPKLGMTLAIKDFINNMMLRMLQAGK